MCNVDSMACLTDPCLNDTCLTDTSLIETRTKSNLQAAVEVGSHPKLGVPPFWVVALTFVVTTLFQSPESFAGMFNMVHFLGPGEAALGIEPELLFSGGAAGGVTGGANLKFNYGLNDSNNVIGILGTGGPARGLRIGGAFTFDIFPDVEKQPGIGLALQGLFVQLPSAGSVEVTGTPYIHKNIISQNALPVEPFLGVPVGLGLSQGAYQVLVTLAVGALFQHSDHLRSVLECGIGLNNTSTYLSGGLAYYF